MPVLPEHSDDNVREHGHHYDQQGVEPGGIGRQHMRINLVDVRGDWEDRDDIRIQWWVTKKTIEEIEHTNIDPEVTKPSV